MELTERARRIYRNYPPHVQQREQAKLILELVDAIEKTAGYKRDAERFEAALNEWEQRTDGEIVERNPKKGQSHSLVDYNEHIRFGLKLSREIMLDAMKKQLETEGA
jgi:hypothetical protein